MRQVLSTALVALIVSVLTVTAVGVLAQDEAATTPERVINPAGFNADKVDGKHAIGFTNNRLRRKNKLVATNRYGLLPPNIVKPRWNLIQGKPAGFADGVDSEGVTGFKLTYVETATHTLPAGVGMADTAFCPPGTKVTGGGFYSSAYGFDLNRSQPYDNLAGWAVGGRNTSGGSIDVITMAVCMSTTPGGALTTATKG